jgi:hypothetical protein
MNQPDQEQIDHWLAVSMEGIDEKWRLYQSGFYEQENLPVQGMYGTLSLLHASLARAKFLNGDPLEEVRAEFATAARHVMKSFTMAYDESDPDYQGEAADLSEVSETIAIGGFNYALMAADFELAAAIGRSYRNRPDGYMLGIDTNRYTNALAFTLQERLKEAKKLLDAQFADYAKRPPKSPADRNYYTLINALYGILERNEQRFNEGLQAQLESYEEDARGELKNTDEEFICDYAVALANLGIHHGLKVTVEHDTLPRGLLINA